MESFVLKLTDMANGGDALGRDEGGRVVFVPFAIAGEEVLVEIVEDKERYAHGRLQEVVSASPERVEPRCPHFGACGICHWAHIDYEAQLKYKRAIVRDQLARIGGLEDVTVRPTVANPEPYGYRTDISFSPTEGGGLGYWSPYRGEVIPIDTCYIMRERLLDLYQDLDFSLPGLRRLTLRLGDDEALLLALETEGVEAPELVTDFPVSVAMVLPDGSAANLVGDNYVVKTVKERDFRVSAGSFFYPSPPVTAALVDTVLELADLRGSETVLEAYSGVGTLTAFLSPRAAELIAIEAAPDAVADAEVNLEHTDNVVLYMGLVEDVLPQMKLAIDLLVVDPPPDGLPREVVEQVVAIGPRRVVYVGSDVATMARDGRQLDRTGYRLEVVQPIDMEPQTSRVLTVSLWARG